jgi:hypothetical protein
MDLALSLDDEIRARIRAAKVWDKVSSLEDFQIRAHANGLVLINLKTGRAQLLHDEDSELQDWKELFPNLVQLPERETRR